MLAPTWLQITRPRFAWRWILSVLLVAAVSLALTASAQAASIVFIKEGNVWLANPDGTGQYQVTFDGGYRSPSQADDGTIVAIRGSGTTAELHRMRQNGELLNPPIQTSAPGTGPLTAAVSPDGQLVAYDFVTLVSCGFACIDTAGRVFYSYANRFTPGDEIESAGGFHDPSWTDSGRTMIFSGLNTWTDVLGPEDATMWWSDSDNIGDFNDPNNQPQNVTDGEVAGGVIVAVRGDDRQFLQFWGRTDSSFSTEPVPACYFSGATGGVFSDPTLAPDGLRAAWQEADGIWSAPVLANADCPSGDSLGLIIPGGSEPDFGPANVNPPPRSTGGGGGGGGDGTVDAAAPAVSLAIVRARLGAALRRGLAALVSCSEACDIVVRVVLDRRTARRLGLSSARPVVVARGSRRLSAAGRARVIARFTSKAKRRLRRTRSVRLTIRATATDRAGNRGTKSRRVTLRR
jgi:hypothetical protein